MSRLVNKTPLVIVTGFDREATIRIAEALAVPGAAFVHHDLTLVSAGTIVRTVSTTDFDGERGSHTTQSALDPALEPGPMAWAITNVVVSDVPGQIDGPTGLDVSIEAWPRILAGVLMTNGRWHSSPSVTSTSPCAGRARSSCRRLVGCAAVRGAQTPQPNGSDHHCAPTAQARADDHAQPHRIDPGGRTSRRDHRPLRPAAPGPAAADPRLWCERHRGRGRPTISSRAAARGHRHPSSRVWWPRGAVAGWRLSPTKPAGSRAPAGDRGSPPAVPGLPR